jgi:hypothetical protein
MAAPVKAEKRGAGQSLQWRRLVEIGSKRCAFSRFISNWNRCPRFAVIERAPAPADERVRAGL